MVTIELWHMTDSPPSWPVRMMADILGLTVKTHEIDFSNFEHKTPKFRKMNPMGTVPLIKDGSLYLSDSHAIIKYLLEKYGNAEQKALYPSEILKRALVDQAMFFDTGVAFLPARTIALPAFFDGAASISPQGIKEAENVYDIVELYLSDGRTFIAINEFTIADLNLGSTILALDGMYSINKSKFPLTVAWLERLRAKPFFQKIAVPGSQELSESLKSLWEKNKK